MVIPGSGRFGRASAVLIWVAIALVLADVIAYRAILATQGGPPPDSAAVVPFVGGYMLLMAALLVSSFISNPRIVRLRPAMLAAAAGGLGLLGLFGLFSIGLPLFVAGVLSGIAGIRAALAGRSLKNALLAEVAASVIAVAVLVAGFEVTQRIIVCPPTGQMGGGSSGFLTGPYHYQCTNGTLTWYSGDCNGVTGGVDSNGNPISANGC